MPWRKRLGEAMADIQVTPELVAQVKSVLDELAKQKPDATPYDRMDIAVAFLIKESLERKKEMIELRGTAERAISIAQDALNMVAELSVA